MKYKNNNAIALSLTAALLVGSSSGFAATTWKIAGGDSEGSSQHAFGLKFVEQLEANTDSEFSGQLFMSSQLGSEQDTVVEAGLGTLDFSILAINNVTPFSPTVGVFTLPYVIQSLEEAELLTQGEVGAELVENTVNDAGVRIVGWAYTGFRVLTNSKQPIETLEDLQQVIVRVPKNEIMIDTYKAWGGNPTPMAWSETFTALQQGVVDGQDNPYVTVDAMKFDTVQKYVTNIRYIFSIEPLIMSESVYQAQTPEIQQAIIAAGKVATKHSAEFLTANEARIKQQLIEKGMVINDPANGEKEWIEKATTAVWPKHYDSIGGKDKLNRILRLLGRDEV
ncbi:TRAP transporter substrate-binding protein [Amphritea balenae]|uniref:TRAP transporter substrate-binding protein n=1 Tax=Amphritea balenae TaxID=452629 RepID=A0A3P1SWP2_9GAMM|nr:TRAP transporter substrate-binding protein [Amphritea balenae]RRD01544.1 TRAP transporter substrate-binding protein [Amphritea balenae]GGK56085.1 Taurine transporter periplasmatic component [Amphritea balenae]